MKQEIIDKRIEFIDFYKQLCTFLDQRGVLADVVVEHCIIVNVPTHYEVFEMRKTRMILGFKFSESTGRFCGFICDGVVINENRFVTEGFCENCGKNVGKCSNCGC